MRRKVRETICLLSHMDPKAADEALRDEYWRKAMEEEIYQILKNDTCTLVTQPNDKFSNCINLYG